MSRVNGVLFTSGGIAVFLRVLSFSTAVRWQKKKKKDVKF